ncbi:MAG TPA: DUF3108 domain-containing protein [Novimethylophilus sp.]|jgi:hypothetical protein|uniref:DUF3108 domain-containing protein n=1 Tax=Novimethylophilus sp. TaxID=2137426 RepID=UPI002F415E8C
MNKYLLLLSGLLASCVAIAAPQKVTAVYEATRDGKPFATVNETYRREGDHYRIESVTTGKGVYALFGKRRLTSEGEVNAEGLKPHRFEQQQGDNARKTVAAEFDWAAGKLTLSSKKKTTTVDLVAGTQDLASFTYQFMFQPPAGEEFTLPVTTGKRLRNYQYRVTVKDETLDGVLGGLKVVRLSNAVKDGDDDEKELWLATDKYFIPAKIVLRDENGMKIEQVLTSLSFE